MCLSSALILSILQQGCNYSLDPDKKPNSLLKSSHQRKSEVMRANSRNAAREEIEKISSSYGFVGEDIFESLAPEMRKRLEDALLNKDMKIGEGIRVIATKLYSSHARFVFELLQNADDNSFERAKAAGDDPFVSFEIHPDRIIVECNEDGFTSRDLTAICNVGQSSKKGAQGYIGEKGIGFKSVFMAASKVLIQSGYYTFYFKHAKGDSGLGMVIPIWKDIDTRLKEPLTRMTLYLSDVGEIEYLKHQRKNIDRQFRDMEKNCLLFMKNLRAIKVSFFDEEEILTSSDEFAAHPGIGTLISLHHQSDRRKVREEKTTHYHVISHTTHGLSQNENREYSETEELNKAYSTAKVVLAFPVTNPNDWRPILETQQVYAYLPVRNCGFKFLIQSDFVTEASRQDIVTTSLRNRGLLDGTAKAFMKAALQFSKMAGLRFRWPEYLPVLDEIHDPFWRDLVQNIKQKIQETPLFVPRRDSGLRAIKDISILRQDFTDEDECPLLDDAASDPFINPQYTTVSFKNLEFYGLNSLQWNNILRLVELDLKSSNSKIQSAGLTENWKSRFYSLLSSPFEKDWPNTRKRIKNLDLIPVSDGRWVSAISINGSPRLLSLYLPRTKGFVVPTTVDLPLVSPGALRNRKIEKFLSYLEIPEPGISLVRTKIMNDEKPCSLEASVSHLRYLYLTHGQRHPKEKFKIKLFSSEQKIVAPDSEDVYLLDDDPYGPRTLFAPPKRSSSGYGVSFLNPAYLKLVPPLPDPKSPTWSRWLHDIVGIRERIRLVTSSRQDLDGGILYVAESQDSKFLEVLKRLWKFEGQFVKSSSRLVQQIQGILVPTYRSSPQRTLLKKTYLPLKSLKTSADRFMAEDDEFPFLRFDDDITNEQSDEKITNEWSFLCEHFCVSSKYDVDFLLNVLLEIKEARLGLEDQSVVDEQRIVDLYCTIQAKCLEATNRDSQRDYVRSFIDEHDLMYIPSSEVGFSNWTRTSGCIWNAPSRMHLYYPLSHVYDSLLQGKLSEKRMITDFFTNTLKIEKLSRDYIIEELDSLVEDGSCDLHHIRELYNILKKKHASGNQQWIREKFAARPLILLETNGKWAGYKLSECLWSSTDISGRVSLCQTYSDLKEFFTEDLGVETLTFELVHNELIDMGSREVPISDLRAMIKTFNSLLQREAYPPQPSRISSSRILPVRYPDGQVKLDSAITDFAIIDRQQLADSFADKAKFLDYTLEEAQQLRPFFMWLGLEDRFLSKAVKCTTCLSGKSQNQINDAQRDIRRRAHALLRITAHFGSPKYEKNAAALYELLRKAETIETDSISLNNILEQGQEIFEIKGLESEVHIEEQDSALKIYVPQDSEKQQFCYSTALPLALAKWLFNETEGKKVSPSSSIIVAVKGILYCSLSTVQKTLEYEGIGNVDVEEITDTYPEDEVRLESGLSTATTVFDELGDSIFVSSSPITPSVLSDTAFTHIATNTVAMGANRQRVQPQPHEPDSPSLQRFFQSYHSSNPQALTRDLAEPIRPTISPAHSPLLTVVDNSAYRRMLINVVNHARRAYLPSRGIYDMSGLLGQLSAESLESYIDDPYDFHSASTLERDMKIGAAGELYVFELLSRPDLGLSNWSQDNWQSTIRKYVSVHPEYTGMPPWHGMETSDITYDDTRGEFVSMLIEKGYLDRQVWRNARPKCYIEVKTSTGPCETQFYMSKRQYKRMRTINTTNHAATDDSLKELYMIFRIFNVKSKSIGLRLYVDPQQLRQAGQLKFTAETWTVVPRNGGTS